MEEKPAGGRKVTFLYLGSKMVFPARAWACSTSRGELALAGGENGILVLVYKKQKILK